LLPGWDAAREILAGRAPAPTARATRPSPELLPANERRRAPDSVAIALHAALSACRHAQREPGSLRSVFTSMHGDLAITDYMCATLANDPKLVSPTRFHNSVHNAAAGYWSIAAGSTRPYTALSAGSLSFAAGHLSVSRPVLEGFNFTGGMAISPELTALLAALVLHHAAHISEVVRGGVLAVPRRQRDAGAALGLTRRQVMRLVVLPQALRAMVPLVATNCVSLTKNSSLAVAIGFPDVVSILNTTANQTGHAIETMLLMIVVYLTLSLVVAAGMDAYNRRLLRPGA
jgi:ABC-type amino acid transport system permease subunit